MRAEKMKTIIAILLLLVSTGAMAQQRTFYDANGRVTGRQATHSNGSTTIYDASGRVIWPHINRQSGHHHDL